jgi:hypothetical protein
MYSPMPDLLMFTPVPKQTRLTRAIQIFQPNFETGPWVAGGAAVRVLDGKEDAAPGDIDVFVRNKEQERQVTDRIHGRWNEVQGPSATQSRHVRTITVMIADDTMMKIQIIRRDDVLLPGLLADFDMPAVQFATDGLRVVGFPQSYADHHQRSMRLSPSRGQDPTGGRVLKYLSRGYRLTPGFLTDLFKTDKLENCGGGTVRWPHEY